MGASGDLDIACPSHPEVIMKKDCGRRGRRGAKEVHVYGSGAGLCLRRVVTTRDRGFLPGNKNRSDCIRRGVAIQIWETAPTLSPKLSGSSRGKFRV